MKNQVKCLLIAFVLLPIAVATQAQTYNKEIITTLRQLSLKEAEWAMEQKPVTITAESCSRSAGTKHDFYSEGDYWWPNPKSPDSPYVQRDGMTNPQNFVAHRLAMIRFSRIMGALGTAYKLTGDQKYVKQALLHLNAWYINPETMMNPNLQYSQAIKGVATGRGIGVIDAIQWMEIVQGVEAIQNSPVLPVRTLKGVKAWFVSYLTWVTTHKYGNDEMNAKNNHGTCWVMQVACFAKFTGNQQLLKFCTDRFTQVLLPTQMAANGSFPLELKRTKPYGYSIFNLDAMTTICQILSTPQNNLWTFETPDGRSIKKGIAFLYPYLNDKNKWPYPHDVMYWECWPVAQPSLLFGGIAYNNAGWLSTWKTLNHTPENDEVIRNLPVRHPLIWLN